MPCSTAECSGKGLWSDGRHSRLLVTDLTGASTTQMASHRRAVMTDEEIDGAVQQPMRALHVYMHPRQVYVIELIFHSPSS